MNKPNHNREWFTSSEADQRSERRSGVNNVVKRTSSLHVFYIITGLCLVLLGSAVITITILGFLAPFWLSTAMSMLASVSTMIGLYLVYITISKTYDRNRLLRNAMRRVMESKN